MAQIRLVPSSYSLSNTSYLSVSDASNMYNNTDNTTYATVTNSRASTSSYYIYISGFNFDDIPSSAVVNSFSVKLKAYESGASTSSSYVPYLCNGTSTISGCSSSAISTSAQTLTFSTSSTTWDTIKGYGSSFGIRINCRRASRNTTSYVYIYGAEILVDYTIPIERTITTSTDSSDITLDPSGSSTVYDGDSFKLLIDSSEEPIVTDNGTDVSSSITTQSKEATISSVISSYSTSGSITGTYYQSAVGKGSSGTSTTGNNYCSSSGSTAEINYSFDISDVPSGAEITDVSCSVLGHCESTSNSSEVAKCQLYAGTTAKGSATSFTSTSDSVITLDCGSWTRDELDSLILKFTIGYYGGNVSGATLSISYSLGEGTFYVYTISSVGEDHEIVVSLNQSAVYYTVTSTIQNGTISSNNPASVREGSSTVIKFSGNDGYVFSSMTVDDVAVTPTLVESTETVNWSVSTNYGTYSTYALSNINDGSTSSYWWSSEAQASGKYVLITFDSDVKLNSFSTYSSHSTDYPQSCNSLQISSDGENWTDVGTFQDASTSSFTDINKSCKYVRIYANSTISNWLVINEITIDYSVESNDYTYTLTNVTSGKNVSIIFVIAESNTLYIKVNGVWKAVSNVYKKTNGTWVEISDLSTLDTSLKYAVVS